MNKRLSNKTAVITGASTGIGQAVARLFAEHGAYVLINYKSSRSAAEALVSEIVCAGGRAVAVQADVAQQADVQRLLAEAQQNLGQIDIWANIAGADILTGDGARQTDLEKLDSLIAVDLRGTMLCCWAVAPLMQQAGSGVILNMSWDLVLQGMEGVNPQMFAAVKAGVMGFSKCLARHYAPEVRVNDLAPGWIATEFALENMREEYFNNVVASTPLKRFGKPEDIANAALYLASDEAAFITGQTLRVNGGLV